MIITFYDSSDGTYIQDSNSLFSLLIFFLYKEHYITQKSRKYVRDIPEKEEHNLGSILCFLYENKLSQFSVMIHCYLFLYNTQHFLGHMNHHVSLEMKWKHKFPSSLSCFSFSPSRVCLVVYTWNPNGRNIVPIYRELGTMEYVKFYIFLKEMES